MIGFLTVVAVAITVMLVAGAAATLSRSTPIDAASRGPWGVVEWKPARARSLDPHQRRWQTALLEGARQTNRWPDVVDGIRRLEAAAELDHDPAPPPEFDLGWVQSRVERIEHHLNDDPTSPTGA